VVFQDNHHRDNDPGFPRQAIARRISEISTVNKAININQQRYNPGRMIEASVRSVWLGANTALLTTGSESLGDSGSDLTIQGSIVKARYMNGQAMELPLTLPLTPVRPQGSSLRRGSRPG
jgi:hypothetical protein